jgi:hypothetical protein
MKGVRVVVFMMLIVTPLWAQDNGVNTSGNIYFRGDMAIRFGLAPIFPLYTHTFQFTDWNWLPLSTGFGLHLGFDYYLSNNLKVGATVAFAGARGATGVMVFDVPITARLDWEFHAWLFDFPVGVEAGVIFTRYRELAAINFIFKPHAGAYYNITNKWSVGLDFFYWIIPQIVWDDLSKSRVGTKVEIAVSARYRL